MDFKVKIQQYYCRSFHELAKFFREQILTACDDSRIDGFADALSQNAVLIKEQDGKTRERWRLDNSRTMDSTVKRIDKIRKIYVDSFICARLLTDFLIDVMFFLLGVVTFLFLHKSPDYRICLLPLIPVALLFLVVLCLIIATFLVKKELKTVFYSYGYAEGVAHLSDVHNIHGEPDLQPISTWV